MSSCGHAIVLDVVVGHRYRGLQGSRFFGASAFDLDEDGCCCGEYSEQRRHAYYLFMLDLPL